MRTLLLLRCIVLASAEVAIQASQPEQIAHTAKIQSVCSILESLESLNGKMIAVRGVVQGGGHGAFLVGTCGSKLVTKGFTWPDVIWLTFPSRSDTRLKVDFEAYERVQRSAKRLRRNETDQVIMTYEGILEVRDLENSSGINSAGRPVGFGYGPRGDAPAQLVVSTARDPQVLPQGRPPASAPAPK
jgi:hypothetical protein